MGYQDLSGPKGRKGLKGRKGPKSEQIAISIYVPYAPSLAIILLRSHRFRGFPNPQNSRKDTLKLIEE